MDGYHRYGRDELSPREREVVALMAKGLTNGEIAERLGIAFDTAKSHVSAVIAKLGADSREDAVAKWRESQAVRARLSKAMKGLLAGAGAWKLAAGAVGAVVVATAAVGGVAWLGGDDNAGLAAEVHVPLPPAVVETPVPSPSTLARGGAVSFADALRPIGPDIDIATVQAGDRTVTLGVYEASLGWCMYVIDEESRAQGGRVCVGPLDVPHLLATREQREGGVASGLTERVADRVQLVMEDGSTVEVPLVEAPPELGLTWRFWLASLPDPNELREARLLSRGGAVIETDPSVGPAGGPPPYAEVDISGSGRDEPLTGTIPTGTYHGSVFKVPAGTDSLGFRVEHDGENAIRISLQCSAPLADPSFLPLVYVTGPGPGGSGSFEAEWVPLGETCKWFVSGYDGNYRIRARP